MQQQKYSCRIKRKDDKFCNSSKYFSSFGHLCNMQKKGVPARNSSKRKLMGDTVQARRCLGRAKQDCSPVVGHYISHQSLYTQTSETRITSQHQVIIKTRRRRHSRYRSYIYICILSRMCIYRAPFSTLPSSSVSLDN